jgi:hypothetical protein
VDRGQLPGTMSLKCDDLFRFDDQFCDEPYPCEFSSWVLSSPSVKTWRKNVELASKAALYKGEKMDSVLELQRTPSLDSPGDDELCWSTCSDIKCKSGVFLPGPERD